MTMNKKQRKVLIRIIITAAAMIGLFFIPFGEGLVEVPEGVRIVSVLDAPLDQIRIGMKLKLAPHVLFTNEEGEDVVAWKFKAV